MVKKRSRRDSRQVQRSVDTNSQVKTLLVATVALLSALLILNVVSLTGFAVNHRDQSQNYLGFDSCSRVGGIALREGTSANHNGKKIMLISTSDNVIAVSIDGESVTIKAGHESYKNGVSIKNFVSTETDACLILN